MRSPVDTKAIAGGRGDSYLLLIEGANHFSIANSFDSTTGRPFLDFQPTQPAEQLRNLIVEAIGLFIDAHVFSQITAIEALNQLLASNNPLIALGEQK